MKILISTSGTHRDELGELKEYLSENSWSSKELTQEEITGVTQMINYCINKRINNKATDLSYMKLLEVINKLRNH